MSTFEKELENIGDSEFSVNEILSARDKANEKIKTDINRMIEYLETPPKDEYDKGTIAGLKQSLVFIDKHFGSELKREMRDD